VRYLLDEHINPLLRRELLRAAPDLEAWIIGDPGAQRRGTLDPDILLWCEANHFCLVTNNRKSMPRHLVDHLAIRVDSQLSVFAVSFL
jgi:predicted nuclease of predicted toxin-antitoxin system